MEDNFNLENCNNDEVLACKDKVFKIGQIKEAVEKLFCGEFSQKLYDSLCSYGIQIDPGGYLVSNKFYKYNNRWFEEGIECEILKIGSKGWQQGKLRLKVTLEFISEEPEITNTESPLDDLRRMINEDNS